MPSEASCFLVFDQKDTVNSRIKILSAHIPICLFVSFGRLWIVRFAFAWYYGNVPSPMLKFGIGNADIQKNDHETPLCHVTKNLLPLDFSERIVWLSKR